MILVRYLLLIEYNSYPLKCYWSPFGIGLLQTKFKLRIKRAWMDLPMNLVCCAERIHPRNCEKGGNLFIDSHTNYKTHPSVAQRSRYGLSYGPGPFWSFTNISDYCSFFIKNSKTFSVYDPYIMAVFVYTKLKVCP